MPAKGGNNGGKTSGYKDKDKPTQIRYSNITAAKGRQTLSFNAYFIARLVEKFSWDLIIDVYGKNQWNTNVYFSCVIEKQAVIQLSSWHLPNCQKWKDVLCHKLCATTRVLMKVNCYAAIPV